MNTLEKLLNLDATVLQKKTGTKKMLCKKLGEELEFPCTELETETLALLKEEAVILTPDKEIRTNEFMANVKLIYRGCPTIFANAQLLKKFGCAEPQELVPKILTEDEITELSNFIYDLSKRGVDEIANREEEVGFSKK